MNEPSTKNDTIDAIMAEMEAKTPKPSDSMKAFEKLNDEKPVASAPKPAVADDVDAQGFFSSIFARDSTKPGKLHPSRPTNERYYDFSNENVGMALIFNQVKVKGESERKGSQKDADNLSEVLSSIGFDVKVYNDFTVRQIGNKLVESKFSCIKNLKILQMVYFSIKTRPFR